jgi:hypothetical protein
MAPSQLACGRILASHGRTRLDGTAGTRSRSLPAALAVLLCAFLSGCASDPSPRALSHRSDVASSPRPKLAHRRSTPRTPTVDAALLAEQPAPDCEYARADQASVDPSEWARIKLDYEKQCYKAAEELSRKRLILLQQAQRLAFAAARKAK